SWATDEHIALAQQELADRQLPVTSLAGWFGSTRDEFERSCALAVALGAQVLGGRTAMLEKDRPFAIATLKRHGLRLGIENHPEKTPDDLLAQIGPDGDGVLG